MSAKKLYQELVERKNCSKACKKRVHDDSTKSVEDSQSSLAQALVASRSPPLSCPPLTKVQTSILSGFNQVMSNDDQLEMAIANSFMVRI